MQQATRQVSPSTSQTTETISRCSLTKRCVSTVILLIQSYHFSTETVPVPKLTSFHTFPSKEEVLISKAGNHLRQTPKLCKTPNKCKCEKLQIKHMLSFGSGVSGNTEQMCRRFCDALSALWHQLHFSGKAVSEKHPAELDEWKQCSD